MRYIFFFLSVLHCSCGIMAQTDSPEILPEVILSDVKLRDHSVGITVQKITDSIRSQSRTSLTDVLRSNTGIYFRENGPGGVSSASFRGTNAAQTAVVWNGININSQLNGQTDFNTISSQNYDQLDVRSGGGSIIYGSGAIGGSIHLNNEITFKEKQETIVAAGYGSFDTQTAFVKTLFSSQKWYIDAAVDFQQSENDFDYLETDGLKNENGAYENSNINLNAGYLISKNTSRTHIFKLHHNSYLSDRNFSGTLTAPSNDAYKDQNARTLAVWENLSTRNEGRLRLAHIFEQFRYYPNNTNNQSSLGKAIRYLANYENVFKFDRTKQLTVIGEATTISASGDAITSANRTIGSLVALWKHQATSSITYELQARQEFVKDYESPFLLGIGVDYAFAKAYKFTLNASQNYRIPTFNDLYWLGAGARGNQDLKPETSNQVDLGIGVEKKNFTMQLRGFYINASDLIKWQPQATGIWSPMNIASSENYGAEYSIIAQRELGDHYMQFNTNYTYTIANDVTLNKRLIYVPEHKVVTSIAHNYKRLSSYIQGRFVDSVFTTTDNTDQVAQYVVANAGLTYKLLKGKSTMLLSVRVNNMFNSNYQTVAFRPNPGRNFFIQTTYTF